MTDNGFIEGDEFDPAFLAEREHLETIEEDRGDNEARNMLNKRKRAYASVFKGDNPTAGDVQTVLLDLAWFCKEFTPTYDITQGAQASELLLIKEGRREVFQRIKDFSMLDEDMLLLKYHNPNA